MTHANAADNRQIVRHYASTAAQIASIAAIMALALVADPDTTTIGEAVEGLNALAQGLSNNLYDLAETVA